MQIPAPALGPRQFFPPPIFYWPYPSPPVSPTSYYAPTMPPPGALPPQQPQQAMVSDGIELFKKLKKEIIEPMKYKIE